MNRMTAKQQAFLRGQQQRSDQEVATWAQTRVAPKPHLESVKPAVEESSLPSQPLTSLPSSPAASLPNMPVDYWKVFATSPGQALLQQIQQIVEEFEHPKKQRAMKKAAQENYLKLIHALSANLAYCLLIQRDTRKTRGGLYVSRSKRILAKKTPKHTSRPTFVTKNLIQLLNTFEATDLIRQVIPEQKTRGRVVNPFDKQRPYGDSTVIHPHGRFAKLMHESAVQSIQDIRRDHACEEIVLLKAKRADLDDHLSQAYEIDYEDNAIADGYRTILQTIQARINATKMMVVHPEEPSSTTGLLIDTRDRRLRRIFTRERWNSCGRYFGGWWQPLSKEERLKRITVDQSYVAELDFSSMMPRLAYGMVGVQPPAGDQYAIPGYERSREGMKILFSALLFDPPGKVRKKLPKNAAKEFHPAEMKPVSEIMADLKAYHQPLCTLFGTGAGHDLFFQESEILTAVLLKLHEAGITALPVHDAVYVPVRRIKETKVIMEDCFKSQVGMEGLVKVKERDYERLRGYDLATL